MTIFGYYILSSGGRRIGGGQIVGMSACGLEDSPSRSEPLTTLKSVQNHLSDLQMLGFLQRHERNEGLNGGLYHEHELDIDPSTVIEIRKQIEDENI